MPQTVEVRFKGTRRAFYAWADEASPLRLQEAVIVRVDRGEDLGRVTAVGAVAAKKCGGSCSCGVPQADKATGEAAAGETAVGEAAVGEAAVGEVAVEQAAESTAVEGTAAEQTAAEEKAADQTAAAEKAAEQTAAAPELPPVLRRASQVDIQRHNELRKSEDEHRRRAAARAREHKLDMKVSDVEWQWDKHRLTVYFTAEQRVDFRALVRELASDFRTRIDLRQIGVRDEAARLTGVGRCGREYCCSTWLTELSPVSLALAKDQHLSLNPTQISGGCGRLLCCLKYEHEFYAAAKKRFPREGKTVVTLRGPEKVVAVDIFRERVLLRGADEARGVSLAELKEEMEQAAAAGPSEGVTPGRQDTRRPDGETAGGRETGRQETGRQDGETRRRETGRQETRRPDGKTARRRETGRQETGRQDTRRPDGETARRRETGRQDGRQDAAPDGPQDVPAEATPPSQKRRRRRRRRRPGQGGSPPGAEGQGA